MFIDETILGIYYLISTEHFSSMDEIVPSSLILWQMPSEELF